MTYPRSKNGYIDDGSLIYSVNRRDRCPKCNSNNYRETISLEECKSCGLRCDYWGGGGNDVYNNWLSNHQAMIEQRERETFDKQMKEEYGDPDTWWDDV